MPVSLPLLLFPPFSLSLSLSLSLSHSLSPSLSLFLSREYGREGGSKRAKERLQRLYPRGRRESDKWLPEEVLRLRKLSEDTRESISLKDP